MAAVRALAQNRRHSFDGNEFPAKSTRAKGTGRKKDHEYPRQPGARTEKQGRKLWMWTMDVGFHATLDDYPNLYPVTYHALRTLFITQETKKFIHPTDGPFDGWICDWQSTLSGGVTSGLSATFTIQEDRNPAFDARELAPASRLIFQSVDLLEAAFAKVYAQLGQEQMGDVSLFDQIINLSNQFFGALDRAELGSQIWEARVLRLQELIQEADARAEVLLHPDGWPITHALGALMDTIVNVVSSPGGSGLPDFKVFVVPQKMSLAEASAAIFDGDASRGEDLTGFNTFPDPTAIQAGTEIKYLAPQSVF